MESCYKKQSFTYGILYVLPRKILQPLFCTKKHILYILCMDRQQCAYDGSDIMFTLVFTRWLIFNNKVFYQEVVIRHGRWSRELQRTPRRPGVRLDRYDMDLKLMLSVCGGWHGGTLSLTGCLFRIFQVANDHR